MASDQGREEQGDCSYDVDPNVLNPKINPNIHYAFKLGHKPQVSLCNHTLPPSAQSAVDKQHSETFRLSEPLTGGCIERP